MTIDDRIDEFEEELCDLLDKHNIPMLVVTYRIDNDHKTSGFSDDDPFNDAACLAIVTMIADMMHNRASELQAAIAKAIAEAN